MPKGVYIKTREHIKKAGKASGLARKGLNFTEEHKRKIGENNACYWLGKKLSQKTKEKMSEVKEGLRGEATNNWKGDRVGYVGLHKWVYRKLGKPQICKDCGATKRERKLNWANKSGKYLRDLKDWISLCIPCHKVYDRKTN